MTAIYRHENGYKAVLYGKSSMSIYKGDTEVLHTGFRSVNTEEEVMECLDEMPRFEAMVNMMVNDKEDDDGNIER